MISSHTFAERLYNCSSFQQEKNYASIIRNVSLESIKLYRSSSEDCGDFSFFSLLMQKFSQRSSSLRNVLRSDKERMEDLLIIYAENISKFFHRFELNIDNCEYVYRHKVTGSIVGTTDIKGKTYNVDMSFRSTGDTFYHLYYHKLNFFLYNQSNGTKNDGLVYIPATDSMYIIKYKADDYTINRGFLDYNINNRTVRPGHQCLYCSVKNCKPRLIDKIDRFII